MACQGWANTMAAYRFLSNERVNERDILPVISSAHASNSRRLINSHWHCTTRPNFPMTGMTDELLGSLARVPPEL
jgi:hypothetical protein